MLGIGFGSRSTIMSSWLTDSQCHRVMGTAVRGCCCRRMKFIRDRAPSQNKLLREQGGEIM
jgi:hypothetical protein